MHCGSPDAGSRAGSSRHQRVIPLGNGTLEEHPLIQHTWSVSLRIGELRKMDGFHN